jgi:hypothetical protein
MVVVEFAKSSRAKCHSCSSCIGEGNLKYGTAVNNDGYLNMQWHHEGCFWNKRVGKYFRRKGKKINYLLRYQQFSNTEILSVVQQEELHEKILETNLKHGTEEALGKAGIARPASIGRDDNSLVLKQTGRKRKVQETREEVTDDPVASASLPQVLETHLDPTRRVTRSRAKILRA